MRLKDALDPDFIERQWKVQRVLWAIMALVVVATGVGAFGGGPLALASSAAAFDGGEARLDYQRINRWEHDSMLFVRVHAPQASGDELNVTLSPNLADSIVVASTMPQSDGASVGPAGATYTWQVDDWSQPVVVAMNYEPKSGGLHDGKVRVQAGDGAPVELPMTRFIFP